MRGATRTGPGSPVVGVVANGDNPRVDWTPEPHEVILIGDNRTYLVEKSEYLYCITNEA